MSLAGKLFRFFLYSNLFIACCATLMVDQTFQLLLHDKPDIYFTCFVFFATVCSYSFHWYLTPPDANSSDRMLWLTRNRNVHGVLFFIGICGAGVAALIPVRILEMDTPGSSYYVSVFRTKVASSLFQAA